MPPSGSPATPGAGSAWPSRWRSSSCRRPWPARCWWPRRWNVPGRAGRRPTPSTWSRRPTAPCGPGSPPWCSAPAAGTSATTPGPTTGGPPTDARPRNGSVAGEGGLALLLEGGDALAVVVGAGGGALARRLGGQDVVERPAAAGDAGHQILREEERRRRPGGDGGHQRPGGAEQLAVGVDLVGDGPLDGLGTGQEPTGVHQLQRAGGPDAGAEEQVGAGVEDGADGGERAADLRPFGDDEQVAGQGQAEPGAEGGALHRRHRRAAQPGQAGHHRVEAVTQDGLAVPGERVGAAQVASGAEALALAPHGQRPGRGLLPLVEGAGPARPPRIVVGL